MTAAAAGSPAVPAAAVSDPASTGDTPAADRPKLTARASAATSVWKGYMREPISLAEAWQLTNLTDHPRPPRWWWPLRFTLFLILITLPTAATAPVLRVIRPAGRLVPTVADPDGDQAAEPAAAERGPLARLAARAGHLAAWDGFAREPMPTDEARRLSAAIDVRRIPGESKILFWFWWWSNLTDRNLLFVLLPVAVPTGLAGALLWCTLRPTRRAGLYLMLFLVLKLVPNMVGS